MNLQSVDTSGRLADVAGVQSPARGDLVAPTELIAKTRATFRLLALDAVERAAAARASSVRIDMGGVQAVDSSGLGVFVLLHKRATERGLRVRLRDTPSHVVELLELTRLRPLFDLV